MKEKKKKSGRQVTTIRFKITLLLIVSMIILAITICTCIVPNVKGNVRQTNQNYMLDMVKSYGDNLNYQISTQEDPTAILNVTYLGHMLENACLEGVDSSYSYVVGSDGTMIYHPKEEDIGTKIDNAVVLGLLDQYQAGTKAEPGVSSYEKNGVVKYISYFVTDDGCVLTLVADEDDIMSYLHTLVVSVIFVCIGLILILGIILFFVVRYTVAPIGTVTKALNRLGQLDFSEDSSLEKIAGNNDETGTMARALMNMCEKLAVTITTIRQQSQQLYDASNVLEESAAETTSAFGNIESAVNEIAQGATSQATETQNATDNVITIGTMIENTKTQVEALNSNAHEMSASNDEATRALQELGEINEQAISSIHIIETQTQTTNESAMKIQDAATLIASIAEETNLLSLNASIEAARAGDAGRGFAVVASQIQKLADQSNESAKKIDDVVHNLIVDSEKAVETMKEVIQIISKQSEYLASTQQVFGTVRDGIGQSIDGVNEIADKADHLDGARTGIIDIVQNLTAIAEENAASTEETSASVMQVNSIMQHITENSENLKEIAESLEHSMREFQL